MTKTKFIEEQIDILLKKGVDKEYLNEFIGGIKDSFEKIDKNTPDELISSISNDIEEQMYNFQHAKNETGESITDALSVCIYLPSETGEYKLKFLGGKTSDDLAVDEYTKFDIASITKMYTLLLTFKLEELGILNTKSIISDLDNRFNGLEDFTIKDLLLLCGELYTKGNPKEGKSIEEANQILQTIYLKSNDRTKNTYTDLGMIVLSKVIEKIVSEKLGKAMSYDEIMSKYIFEPFNLTNTTFNPENYNLAGNGNKLGLVHDPKTRALGGAVGSAGIFTNADDLAKIARNMFVVNYSNYDKMKNLVSSENLRQMGTVTFPNSVQNIKGLVGLYQKNPDRQTKWLNSLLYGDNSFTAQGFTGAIAGFDPANGIHNSILFGAIKDGEAKKVDGFLNAMRKYQHYIIGKSIEILLIKKYYDLMQQHSIDSTYKI